MKFEPAIQLRLNKIGQMLSKNPKLHVRLLTDEQERAFKHAQTKERASDEVEAEHALRAHYAPQIQKFIDSFQPLEKPQLVGVKVHEAGNTLNFTLHLGPHHRFEWGAARITVMLKDCETLEAILKGVEIASLIEQKRIKANFKALVPLTKLKRKMS